MASCIRTLDPRTAMKIAAGEVIDRPASIIRELLDNALDAGATEITINLERGGKKFISVVDNGHGMSREDLAKSFLKHTTSKIEHFDDLFSLGTYGFRGEALSSISEVSECTIASRLLNEDCGSEISVHFGTPGEITGKAMNIGTTVTVKSLFNTMPARVKFLSSESVEYRLILQEILKKSMVNPSVRFEVAHNFQIMLSLLPTDNTLNRILNIMPDLRDVMHAFNSQESGYNIYGFVSDPSWYRSNRAYQYFFVNKRPVDSEIFRTQCFLAYNNLLPKSRFPAVFCYLDVDPQIVDFNVHPQKFEVRFENEILIGSSIRKSLKTAIHSIDNIVAPCASAPNYHDVQSKSFVSSFSQEDDETCHLFADSVNHVDSSDNRLRKILCTATYLGTLFHTYLLFEYEHILYLVDFHAMHERVRYENILKIHNASIQSQKIIPFAISLSMDLMAIIDEMSILLEKVGFIFHKFTETSISIEGIPIYIDIKRAEIVLRELLESRNIQNLQNSEDWDYLCKTLACKGSMRSGDCINKYEIDALLIEWSQCEGFQSCPHGRPIVHNLEKKYFDRMFKRTGF